MSLDLSIHTLNIKHTENTPQLHVNESGKQRDYNVCIG